MNECSRDSETLQEEFDALDGDLDGRIDREEFAALLHRLGVQAKGLNVGAWFNGIDTDRDGRISCREFVAWRCAN